jgi:hypothetical protein
MGFIFVFSLLLRIMLFPGLIAVMFIWWEAIYLIGVICAEVARATLPAGLSLLATMSVIQNLISEQY